MESANSISIFFLVLCVCTHTHRREQKQKIEMISSFLMTLLKQGDRVLAGAEVVSFLFGGPAQTDARALVIIPVTVSAVFASQTWQPLLIKCGRKQ